MTDIAAGKVPVLKCFEQAWRFLFEHWRLFAPAAGLPALANGIALAPGSGAVGGLAGTAIISIATVFFTAVVLRKAVHDEYIPPFGLAAGQDEMRLLGVAACFALLFVPFVTLFALIFGIVMAGRSGMTEAEVEAMAADPEAANRMFMEFLSSPVGALLAGISLAVFVVIVVRLSMINAATIGERRIVFFQTWSWSKGNVLRMIGAMLLTNLPGFLANVIAAEIVTAMMGGAGLAMMVTGAVVGFIGTMLSVPGIALGAILYKGLRPPNFAAK